MTRDEILSMESGRDLDQLVAEQVMGWSRSRYRANGTLIMTPPPGGPYYGGQPAPRYSTDIAAAWEVVEFLKDVREGICFGALVLKNDETQWIVFDEAIYIEIARAGTFPLAVCRAALEWAFKKGTADDSL